MIIIIFGFLAICFGIYILMMRRKSPEKFGKLKAMKEYWGDEKGTTIHIIGYTIIPIVAGLILLFSSLL